MAIFLTREQIYRMHQRELPPGVYPDGAPEQFFSTADSDSVADVLATAYGNLKVIYNNYWPQSAVEKLSDWEFFVLGKFLDQTLDVAERQQRVVSALRTRKKMSIPDLIDIIKSVIGQDKQVEISEWGCSSGGWILDESELEISTILNGYNGVGATTADMCNADPAQFGMTQQEWLEYRAEAYTYEVLIYGYVLTTEQRFDVDQELARFEPARSYHIITDGLDPADALNGGN